jgi:hypothetical protein
MPDHLPIWLIRRSLPLALFLSSCSGLLPTSLAGQDVQPRALSPAPVGSNLISAVYAFSTGAVLTDKTIPVQDLDGDVHSFSFAYGRAFGLFGLAAKADAIVPVVTGRWRGTLQEAQLDSAVTRTGFGDPVARFMFFFAGAPALRGPEFVRHRARTLGGASLRLRVPLGQYDPSKIINIGTNRWMFSPRVGVSQMIGRSLVELYTAGWLFTDNDEFLGENVQSQNPMLTIQLHYAYVFGPGFWAAVGTRQSFGGQLYVNGEKSGDAQTNNRIGVSLTVPVARRQGVKVAFTLGLSTAAGNDYNTFLGAWQMAWGGFPPAPPETAPP